MSASPIRALTLDAMGCLVTMRDPVPAIARMLEDRGTPRSHDVIAVALRREITFYKAHHMEARDSEQLRALQTRAAGVLAAGLDLPDGARPVTVGGLGLPGGAEPAAAEGLGLPDGAEPAAAGGSGLQVGSTLAAAEGLGLPDGATPAAAGGRPPGPAAGSDSARVTVDESFVDGFLAALEFVPVAGVVEALARLDAAGVPMVCVSNWDAGLPAHLERLGIARYLRGVIASGAVGVAKPDPRIFDDAVDLLDVPRHVIGHVGDEPVDRAGALAAGLRFLPPPITTLPERLGLG